MSQNQRPESFCSQSLLSFLAAPWTDSSLMVYYHWTYFYVQLLSAIVEFLHFAVTLGECYWSWYHAIFITALRLHSTLMFLSMKQLVHVTSKVHNSKYRLVRVLQEKTIQYSLLVRNSMSKTQPMVIFELFISYNFNNSKHFSSCFVAYSKFVNWISGQPND